MQQLIDMMQGIGFSQNEAKVYLALVVKNPQNGYEIAKNSDITRTMVYDILKRLIQKDAITEINANPKLYVPVSYKELLNRYRESYSSRIYEIEESIETLKKDSGETNFLYNITDYEDMLREVRSMIDQAKTDIYLSVWEQEAELFMENLGRANERGVNIITFSYGRLPYSFGTIYHYGVAKDILSEIWTRRRFTLVTDRENLLLGEGNKTIEEITVITSNTMMIELAIDQMLLDIIQLSVLRAEGIFNGPIASKKEYMDKIISFHRKHGVGSQPLPRRVDQD